MLKRTVSLFLRLQTNYPMKCPACNTLELVKTERQGFDIDYCPSCRGIWFERGELDKILSKLNQMDLSTEGSTKSEQKQAELHSKEHSAIMDSIQQSKELHNLHKHGGKHHWIHRLFD